MATSKTPTKSPWATTTLAQALGYQPKYVRNVLKDEIFRQGRKKGEDQYPYSLSHRLKGDVGQLSAQSDDNVSSTLASRSSIRSSVSNTISKWLAVLS